MSRHAGNGTSSAGASLAETSDSNARSGGIRVGIGNQRSRRPCSLKPLVSAVILEPGDNWARLALVDGKLLVRGQKELKVLQVAQ